MQDDAPPIRREAAICCSKIAVLACSKQGAEQLSRRSHLMVLVGDVLEKLLVVGISDPGNDHAKRQAAALGSPERVAITGML